MSAAQPPSALLDTSIFIAVEQGRLDDLPPARAAISVVTLAELGMGVQLAADPQVHAQRLGTLTRAERLFEPLPITVDVAHAFADIVAEARRRRRRPNAMDAWIAATAVAHGLPLYTQDQDFEGLRGLTVVRI